MAPDSTDQDRLYIFEIDDTYLFTEYFAQEDLFHELKEYYNRENYRFEVPADVFEECREHLEQYGYEPEVVDDIGEFCVVKDQYTEHAEILKRSVEHWSRDNHHFFIMEDPQAVEYAVEQGAEQLADTIFVLGI